jgi:hypothetical protein
MFSMVFGELYLPISLRGEILVAKKRDIGGLLEKKK